MKIKLAIFASGSGSNAEEICKYFEGSASIEVSIILSNKVEAGVFRRAKKFGIQTHSFTSREMREGQLLDILTDNNIDFVILAGFLLKIPLDLIHAFQNRIINVHPAILPNFGGKGMYGTHVHKAVLKAGETESGITIHLVNEAYDKGQFLFQGKVPVLLDDTADSLASRVLGLEHSKYAPTIEHYINSFNVEKANKPD